MKILYVQLAYQALSRKDSEGNINPVLAENIEVSEDKIEYKFYIRNDKYWAMEKK